MSLDMDLESIDFRVPLAHVSTSPATGDLYVQSNDIGADKDEVQSARQTENIPSGGKDSGKRDEQSTRPKRISKPTAKLIENRFLSDRPKLERLWERTMAAISGLQETPDAIAKLRSAVARVRSVFNEYHVVWLSLMDYTVHASTPECCEERRAVDELMKTRKEFVQAAINEGVERKNDLLQENASARSGSRDSTSSSTSLRAQAKAEAAAALKKAEWQEKMKELETESALLMEREELAFVRKRREQEARKENLRLKIEAAVALARADAIDKELGLKDESHDLPDLPLLDPDQRVREFVNMQPHDQHIPDQEQQPRAGFKSEERPAPAERKVFSAGFPSHSTSGPEAMEPYIQFMARQELIANKIERFNDCPENFHTWKAAFQNMIRNINITPSEELSLMIEYTSKESKKLVQRLRNAFIANPKRGVEESWRKLGERFGSSAVMTQVHLNKLKTFPKIGYKDNKQLQELGDLLLELQCAKEDGGLAGLRILDEPAFLQPIMTKLPENIQNRWRKQAFRYKTQHSVDYPPFAEFSKFIQDLSRERNDPYLVMETPERKFSGPAWAHSRPFRNQNQGPGFTVNKTAVSDPRTRPPVTLDPRNWCVVHRKTHPLQKCRVFRMKPLSERKQLLVQHKICFRCVATCAHLAKNCTAQIKCTECQSEGHVSALHPDPTSDTAPGREHYNAGQADVQNHGEEPHNIRTSCTEVCGDSVSSKSCSKICLASIYVNGHPEMKVRAYAIIDDQSNCSLAKPELFELLELKGEATPYTLKTCAGTSQAQGRHAKGLVIESLDGTKRHSLPVEREEIPTPDAARHHAHLQSIADQIPELDPDAKVLLLIGRDAPQLLKVHESRNGPRKAPWAQRLDLGWVVLGNVCLNGAHKPPVAHAYRTQILYNGRPSLLQPCPNRFHIKHEVGSEVAANQLTSAKHRSLLAGKFEDGLGTKVFHCTKDDNRLGLSIEDRRFLNIMDKGVNQSEEGNWVAPLPFRLAINHVPNNRQEALKRFKSTQRSLDRKPLMKEHYLAFMQNLFDRGHAEPVPPANPEDTGACWYLPHFGVYHPQKPGKIRVVFDSAAETNGVSLNKLLLPGPHLTNSLLGVLLRFRQNPVAFMADVEQMFHSFIVQESHRDFLRFFWYKDNNPSGELTEYRMKVHVFGNTSSPAVASFCLKRTAEIGEAKFGSDARNFVERNFYVDDGLKSVAKPTEAIDLLRRTQGMLATANLRLHKIASNHIDVTQAFPSKDQASDLRDLDLSRDIAPIQRSLGVFWDIGTDTFTFRVAIENKPFTRRGVLSVINGLYDPLGIAAPVIIKGKFLLKAMTSHSCTLEPGDWDKPLPDCHKPAWEDWCRTLLALREVKVPRSYVTLPIEEANRREIHTFCDASNEAIGAVSYLKTVHPDGQVEVSFLLGKAKLAPSRATTIPRLELCAAVLGVELTALVMEELDVELETATYYSDSKVVLGYITNESRRFYIYVSNRVEQIRKSSSPSQWHYVPTHLNPADLATRSVHAQKLDSSPWLSGPQFLHVAHPATDTQMGSLAAETANDDPEVRPEVKVQTFMTNKQTSQSLGSERFSRFSRWTTLIRALAKLTRIVRSFSQRTRAQRNPPTQQSTSLDVKLLTQAKTTVLKTVQYESFATDIAHLSNGERLPKTSALIKLSPTIDSDGLLRLGGRLEQANLDYEERHPFILPGSNHVSTLIVQHFHAKVQHQGRHFTLGLIRSSGFWIIGGKRLVNKVIDKCIKCKRLRGRQQQQKMADLPTDRLTPAPPFSFVGLDVFGPWTVSARRTRGGHANSKRWAVLFTCLTIRAIHIEVIESMDTSSFINALRRFLALRGPVIHLRCDCGSNFVGARNELATSMKQLDADAIQACLSAQNCDWIFNPPHASHAGGIWERMIGVTRRILDSMFADLRPDHLTHEVLTTLMAEVAAIVNARPLTPVPTDPTMPEILTPATLLTQKPQSLQAPPGRFDAVDLFSKQWRQVQHLATIFWSRWRKEYLPMIQPRRKWQHETQNLKEGDLVLLRNKDLARNDWPLARITKALPSADGKVRKAELVTTKQGSRRHYTRPVTELILLRTEEEFQKLKTPAG